MQSNSYPRKNHHSSRNHVMKLNTRSLFTATTVLAGALYIICALFVAILPQTTMAFFGYVSHLDLLEIAQPITWGAFFVGLVFFALGTGISAAFIGYYYNRVALR